MVALIAMWIGLIIGIIAAVPFATFAFGSPIFAFVGAANMFFIIALPIIGFLQFAARYVFKRKTSARTRTGMTLVWILNVISFFSVGSIVVRDFNQEKELTQRVEMHSFNVDTVQLSLGEEIGANSIINFDGAKIIDENLVIRNIEIDFAKSKDDKFRLIQTHYSRGSSSSEIEELTKSISYNPIITDQGIVFPADFFIEKGKKWRKQKVKIKLEVPEGKTVKFGEEDGDNKLERYINHHSRHNHAIPNVSWYGEHIWTMKEEGFYSKKDTPQEIGNDRGFKDFKKIIIKGELKVDITKGDHYEVKLVGKERELKTVTMEQVGEILDVSTHTRRRGSPVRLKITAPDLERIDLEYTDDVNIKEFDGKKLAVFNEGKREVKVHVQVDSLYLNFKRNKSDIRGKGNFLKVKLDQRARMDAEHYTATNAYIQAKNAGTIRLDVVDTLRTDIIQGSRMLYDEDPKIVIDERKVRREQEEQERLEKQKQRDIER
ncbi:MAG: DUF2807 domain-containing protein [Saprospiraceae bacterium]